MGIADKLAKQFLNKAQVISKTEIADHVFHLKISSQHLIDLKYVPGQHLRIFVGMGMSTSLGNKVRTYSIWKYDRLNGIIHLAVCAHTNGPGSSWIRTIQPGQEIYFSDPKGKFIIDSSADNYLFVGDASALAHLYEIRRNLTGSKKIKGVVYAEQQNYLFPDLDGIFPFNFYKWPLNPLKQMQMLLDNELADNLNNTIVYIGGDGRICVELHRYFKKIRKLDSKNIKVKPFWMPGKSGLE